MWLVMRATFCCRFSLFRDFAKIGKTVSTGPGRDRAPVCPMVRGWTTVRVGSVRLGLVITNQGKVI